MLQLLLSLEVFFVALICSFVVSKRGCFVKIGTERSNLQITATRQSGAEEQLEEADSYETQYVILSKHLIELWAK
jgi:hypothetical protein